jgi:hypothetical protein
MNKLINIARVLGISAFVALSTSVSQASNYQPPTWDQVGYEYGLYIGDAKWEQIVRSTPPVADYMLNSLMPIYGPNTAYYFYFDSLGEQLGIEIESQGSTQASYNYFLGTYYAYSFYYDPSVSLWAETYFSQIASGLDAYYQAYANYIYDYYDAIAAYYESLIFPY